MYPYIDVKFYACESDAAVVAAIHRSIARLEQHYSVHRAAIAIRGGGRRTSIDLAVTLADGQLAVAKTAQRDTQLAVADAFRVLKSRLAATKRPSRSPMQYELPPRFAGHFNVASM